MAEPPATPRRHRAAATVLIGAGAAGAAAFAGTRTWFTIQQDSLDVGESVFVGVWQGSAGQEPAATALALVCLAAWGVLLVTRGRVRRPVAVMGALAAAVGLAIAGSAAWRVPARLDDVVAPLGVEAQAQAQPWFVVGLLAFVVTGVTFAMAFRSLPAWPEMGRRYDAPGGTDRRTASPDGDSLDLWKALDEGRDPTEGPA